MSPLALDLLIRSRVINLKRDAVALAAAAAEIEQATGVWPRLEGDDALLTIGALDAAKTPADRGPFSVEVAEQKTSADPCQFLRPRPLLLLPSDPRLLRSLMRGRIHRPH